MKLKINHIGAIFLLIVFQPAYSKQSNVLNVEPVVSEQKDKPNKKDTTICPLSPAIEMYVKAAANRIFKNWEPGNVNIKRVPIVTFQVSKNGKFHNVCLTRSSNNKQIDFSCLQAVYESSGFTAKVPMLFDSKVQITFLNSNKKNSFDCASEFKNDNLSTDSVLWHLIPLEAVSRCMDLRKDIVHSEKNVKFINSKYVNSKLLNNLRREWHEYFEFNSNPTPTEIQNKAKELDFKYSEIFENKTGN